MKPVIAHILTLAGEKGARQNILFLVRFIILVILIIVLYSAIFHYLMFLEGREYSLVTGFYWTLTVMSTLGFGDIAFNSDAGKIFSIFVMLTGVIVLLVMLPFAFIKYFWSPWLDLQKKRSVPRRVPDNTYGHVIIVGINPLSLNLARELNSYGLKGFLLSSDSQTVMSLVAEDYLAVLGEHDSEQSYLNMRLDTASMLVAMDSDARNTSIVFSAREINAQIPIIAKAENEAAVDILRMAGSSDVFHFHKLLGQALARRTVHAGRRVSLLKRFEHLEVVEAPIMRTPLVGRSLRHSELRNNTGINVVGIWERGHFSLPKPENILGKNTVIVAAGTKEQVDALDNLLKTNTPNTQSSDITIILGGGRVGQAAAEYLVSHGYECIIVDKGRHSDTRFKYVQGDAADLEILEKAGLKNAPSIIVTTRDDDTNIYLTIYCRRLRPDIQIISRAAFERNVGILHAAGADLVLSLSSMITNSILNLLSPGKVAMLNEGLNLFRCTVNEELIGKKLSESGVRDRTNCSVVAVRQANDDALQVNPDPSYVFAAGDKFYLIGDAAGEAACYALFGHDLPKNLDEEGA